MQTILQYCARISAPRRRFEPGSVLLHEGQSSGRLYVLISGTIEVTRGDTLVATTSDPGAVFGEMSELLARPHSATVKAVSLASAYELDSSAAGLKSHAELAYGVAQLLARRLHAATTYLVDLKRQFEGHANHFGLIDEVLESILHHQGDFTPGSDRQPDPPA